MKTIICAAFSGALFGAGLVISGMTDPEVVLAFLTLNEQWNPALIAVMGSAVVVASLGFALARRRGRPVFAEQFSEPGSSKIDARLVGGAVIFGAGWGLAGYCPGPALVGAASLDYRALLFIAAYGVGMWLYQLFLSPSRVSPDTQPQVAGDG
jgi:uncharacterized membrane protein YedE/YeeE